MAGMHQPKSHLVVAIVSISIFIGLNLSGAYGQIVDYWLASSGVNGNGLSQASPFTDLNQAVNTIESAAGIHNLTIHFLPGTYDWPGLYIVMSGSNIIIQGEDPQNRPILDCKNAGSSVAINIWGGYTTASQISILNLEVRNNNPINYACVNVTGNPLMETTVTNLVVTGCNASSSFGGGLLIGHGNATISDSVFKNNRAYQGGGVHISRNAGSATIDSTLVDSNIADYNGAGISYWGTGTFTMNKVTCSRNRAVYYGSGVLIGSAAMGNVQLRSSVIKDNPGPGAGVYMESYSSFLDIMDQTQIISNDIGVTIYPVNNKANVSADSIIWGNKQKDLQCSSPAITQVYYNIPTPVELCNREDTCLNTSVQWDRCFVCAGTDACIGCDNVPNSGVIRCSPISYNPTQATVLLQYNGTNPDPFLYPKDPSGSTNPNYYLNLDFVYLREVRPDGSVTVSYDLDALSFYLSVFTDASNITQVVFTYYFTTSAASVVITQTYYPSLTTLESGGIPFNVSDQTLKISIEINDWPFENGNTTQNYLEVKVRAKTGEALQTLQTSTNNLNGSSSFYKEENIYATDNTAGSISFLNFAEFTLNQVSTVQVISLNKLDNESDASMTTFVLRFDGFFDSVFYDPDLSVVITVQDSGDGGDNLGLIIGLSVGIPVACAIVVIVIVVGTVVGIISKRRMRKKLFDALGGSSSGTL